MSIHRFVTITWVNKSVHNGLIDVLQTSKRCMTSSSTPKSEKTVQQQTSIEAFSRLKIQSSRQTYLPRIIQLMISQFKKKMRIGSNNIDPQLKVVLDHSSAQLYYNCANHYAYLKLCEAFGLPDYPSTWFKLTLMHVWMVLMRLHLALEAHSYLRLQRSLLSAMWLDVDKRLEILGNETSQRLTSAKDMKLMHALHVQTLLEYDEGFLRSDVALAGAVWRCLFIERTCDPIHVNRVVHYMRATVAYLDTLDSETILIQGIKEWKTLKPKPFGSLNSEVTKGGKMLTEKVLGQTDESSS
ncbi:hypothetical protein AB6A40_006685 [Gnathostoma spinigerum]|uniref:Ubiquinol-cytochrome c chaperone domain-containing protein n=1 Tax=Gnathostoma spinigerum TaxID=75299 RepID=A0ABD6ERA7_9BILA